MMATYSNQKRAEAALWEQLKDTITHLWVKEDRTLEEVRHILATEHGLDRTTRQCERAVRRLGIKKTVKSTQWKYISSEIARRKDLGKSSVVLVHGQKIGKEIIHKRSRRHFETTLQRHKRRSIVYDKDSMKREGILVRTPSPMLSASDNLDVQQSPNCLSHPERQICLCSLNRNLPWQTFEENINSQDHSQQTDLDDVDELLVQYFDVAVYYRSPFFVFPHNIISNIPSLIDQMLLSRGLTARVLINNIEGLIPYDQAGSPCIDIKAALDPTLPPPRHELIKLSIYLISNNCGDKQLTSMFMELLQFHGNRDVLESLLRKNCVTSRSCAEKVLREALSKDDSNLISFLLKWGTSPLYALRGRIADGKWSKKSIMCVLDATSGLDIGRVPALKNINHMIAPGQRDVEMISILIERGFKLLRPEIGGFLRAVANGKDIGFAISILNCFEPLECPFYHTGVATIDIMRLRGTLGTVLSIVEHEPSAPTPLKGKTYGSALLYAVEEQRYDRIEFLLSLGADINTQNSTLCPGCGMEVVTCLQIAAAMNNTPLVNFLLSRGALPNPSSQHCIPVVATALQSAAYNGNLSLVNLLIRAGADIDWCSKSSVLVLGDDRKLEKIPETSVLAIAARGGDMCVVEALLAAGVSIAKADCFRPSPLEAACKGGFFDIAMLLTSYRASVTGALVAASGSMNLALIKHLIHNGLANEVADAALEAINHNNLDAILLFLDYCSHADAEDALPDSNDSSLDPRTRLNSRTCFFGVSHLRMAVRVAVYSSDVVMLRAIIDHKALEAASESHTSSVIVAPNALCYLAVQRLGDYEPSVTVEIARLLIDAGADPLSDFDLDDERCESHTLLQHVIDHDDLNLAKFLIRKGMNADRAAKSWTREEPPDTDSSCKTALQAAAIVDSLELVDMLLHAGADVNAAASEFAGGSALQFAATRGNAAMVRRLLDNNAEANSDPPWYRGATALQRAATTGSFTIVRMLIEAGAEVNALPARVAGFTALEAAALSGCLDIIQYLLNAGADIRGPLSSQYRRAVGFAWESGHIALADYLQNYKKDHYGADQCQPLQEILESPDVKYWNSDRYWATKWNIRLPFKAFGGYDYNNEEEESWAIGAE